ncbi:efflux RND transporter periplasmic adaptor subunit [candidate division CSSED10-310 bacterium]|uniref:Efflux RND transporter periplasmic adaptor subunit n=1 Tax=candidate division CSSED10-310 bacterium TaxID=2855610 RepID=A0ABV6YZT3_UNCC1
MHIQDTSKQDTVLPRNMKRRVILSVVVGLCLLGATFVFVWLFGHLFQAESSFDRQRLRFATVERGSLVHELSVEGRLIASSYPTIYSAARGRILLKVQPGDKVKKGDLLAIQESPEWENQLLQELSRLAVFETELQRKILEEQTQALINKQTVDLKQLQSTAAKRDLGRTETSYKRGLVNKMDFEKASDRAQISILELNHAIKKADLDKNIFRLDVRNQRKKIEQQQLIVAEAKRKVKALQIISPLNGVVGSVEVNPKDILIPNQPILSIIDLSAFEIQVHIPENMGDDIQVGLAAEIRSEGIIYQGRLASVSPEVNHSLVQGRVVFTQSYPENLKQKQRVDVKIIVSQKDDVLKVKRGPFLESGQGGIAYAVRDDLAEQRIIQTGTLSLTEVEIVKGLAEGETIIISDMSRFENNKTIFLRN